MMNVINCVPSRLHRLAGADAEMLPDNTLSLLAPCQACVDYVIVPSGDLLS